MFATLAKYQTEISNWNITLIACPFRTPSLWASDIQIWIPLSLNVSRWREADWRLEVNQSCTAGRDKRSSSCLQSYVGYLISGTPYPHLPTTTRTGKVRPLPSTDTGENTWLAWRHCHSTLWRDGIPPRPMGSWYNNYVTPPCPIEIQGELRSWSLFLPSQVSMNGSTW